MDPASAASVINKFAEYGGLLGLVIGVLLIYQIYTHYTLSKRLTDLTDKVLEAFNGNTRAFQKLTDNCPCGSGVEGK